MRWHAPAGRPTSPHVHPLHPNPPPVTATCRCAAGRTLRLRKATALEPHRKTIYDTLGIRAAAGGFVKQVI